MQSISSFVHSFLIQITISCQKLWVLAFRMQIIELFCWSGVISVASVHFLTQISAARNCMVVGHTTHWWKNWPTNPPFSVAYFNRNWIRYLQFSVLVDWNLSLSCRSKNVYRAERGKRRFSNWCSLACTRPSVFEFFRSIIKLGDLYGLVRLFVCECVYICLNSASKSVLFALWAHFRLE